mmetsp:Transcript_26363/g.54603  ORF Transcript_26363/g.54603 Transcript_26363/m.54603 type:complete len:228 (+) Transcript_26363:94-777(+)
MGASTTTTSTPSKPPANEAFKEAEAKPCFLGSASFSHDAIPMPQSVRNGDATRSFAAFMASPDSDMTLLGAGKRGTGVITKLDDIPDEVGEVWESQQESVRWFGLTISPSVICSIEREKLMSDTAVKVKILNTKTGVSGLGIVGKSTASIVERAKTTGTTEFSWEEDPINGVYKLAANFELKIFVRAGYIPSSVKSIGSKFVTDTCKKELKRSVQNVFDAYVEWSKE